jgi:hypothetical protein
MTQQLIHSYVPSQEATWGGNGGQSSLVREPDNGTPQPSSVIYQVVHAIPGRIRFRIPQLRHDPEYAQRLQTLSIADAWVTGVRINRTAASIAFTYQPIETEATQKRSRSISEHAHNPENGSEENAIASIPETDISHLTKLIQAANTDVAQPQARAILPQQPTPQEVNSSSNPHSTLSLPILSCSLEVRQATVSADCGLLKSKTRKPLIGGALAARMTKLRRLSVWFEPSIEGLPAVGVGV